MLTPKFKKRHSVETCAKIAKSMTGKTRSEESRRKQSETATNKVTSAASPVRVNRVIYPSVLECARKRRVGKTTVYNRIASPNFPEWQWASDIKTPENKRQAKIRHDEYLAQRELDKERV